MYSPPLFFDEGEINMTISPFIGGKSLRIIRPSNFWGKSSTRDHSTFPLFIHSLLFHFIVVNVTIFSVFFALLSKERCWLRIFLSGYEEGYPSRPLSNMAFSFQYIGSSEAKAYILSAPQGHPISKGLVILSCQSFLIK